MKCFIDMDGVLTDFVGGACRAHGRPNPYETGVCREFDIYKLWDMTAADFWAPLGESFWANLEWCHDGEELLAIATEFFGVENCCILTSPCKTLGCESGKVAWIRRHAPQFERQFLIGAAKHFCAHPNVVLIDDYFVNVEKFREHGGKAVVIPRPWSCLPLPLGAMPGPGFLRFQLNYLLHGITGL